MSDPKSGEWLFSKEKHLKFLQLIDEKYKRDLEKLK